ncbi:MbcA/ParS/Xre antitoxin family protein [Stappia sp. MMSF_3263]|uniref:MbcA/ParS/Xre antitoxin family protein n=1 Tax=Stappia sp. MMSF_3263 TaxID=3046693 RepID=UPI00273CF54A|nr:MbcA/ParS/Xre antitoxin family protein [Stappia sp. MMSF_3263]
MPELHLVSPAAPAAASDFSTDEIRAMQRATIALFARWGLSDEQASRLLGDISVRTYQRWKTGTFGRVGVDLAERMSNLMGIHKALRLLFREAERGYGWISRPNADFDGRSALDVMLQGRITDLMRVRRYLDARRGQW